MVTAITCPRCGGQKKVLAMFPVYADHVPREQRKSAIEMDCFTCNGDGVITTEYAERMAVGAKLRARRLAKGLGLRRCAEAIGVKPSELSYAEQGKLMMQKIAAYELLIAEYKPTDE